MDMISIIAVMGAAGGLAWVWSLVANNQKADHTLEVLDEAGFGGTLSLLDAPRMIVAPFFIRPASKRMGKTIDAARVMHGQIVGVSGFRSGGTLHAVFSHSEGNERLVKTVMLLVDVPSRYAKEVDVWSVPNTPGVHFPEHMNGWLDHRLRADGPEDDLLILLQGGFGDALAETSTAVSKIQFGPAHRDTDEVRDLSVHTTLRLLQGMLMVAGTLSRPVRVEVLPSVLKGWLDDANACLEHVPTPIRRDDGLAAIVRDEDAPTEARWRAVIALNAQMGAVDHVALLMEEWDAFPEPVKMAFACVPRADLEPRPRVALLHDAIARGGPLGGRAGEALLAHDAWLGFIHDGIDPRLRAKFALRALTAPSTPEDQDTLEAEIGRVFASRLLGASESSLAFGAMVDSGWRPSPPLLTRIARNAHAKLANRILDHIGARGATVDDAEALTTLRERGHSDRVDPMLEALREGLDTKMMGRLSVSMDAGSSGGLTQAAEGGTLEVMDEDG